MKKFLRELEVGEIHLSDKWQFELKSEFFPLWNLKKNDYIQEFYFFIPNSLHINEETYSKAQFYQDQTNHIRYKTPKIQLQELFERGNKKSPLIRLIPFSKLAPTDENTPIVIDELKLLGNVFRSSLRERIALLFDQLDKQGEQALAEDVIVLVDELREFRRIYLDLQSLFLEKWTSNFHKSHFLYLDEFMSNSINYYLAGFLESLQHLILENRKEIHHEVFELLVVEREHREKLLKEPKITDEDTASNEYVLYRNSLLNKFVLDALLLNSRRFSVVKRFQNIVGSIAAGIAMLFFFVLFVWQGQVFLINSMPFIMITVFLYILKDRMKEGLKALSYRQFTKWFADYKTEIRSPNNKISLGKMQESVSFVRQKGIPKEIRDVRNKEFHDVLEVFKRPEQVLYYKKKISMSRETALKGARRNALNIIFRFNINGFLEKADNPKHSYIAVNPDTEELTLISLPKVYHLNMILKNTYTEKNNQTKSELKKFRLILDKNGIKRIEHVHS